MHKFNCVCKWHLYSNPANSDPEKTLWCMKSKERVSAPDKMLLFHVKIIVVVSSVTALEWLKKEEQKEGRKSSF